MRIYATRDVPDINLVYLLRVSHVPCPPTLQSTLDLDGRPHFWTLGLASWELLRGHMTTLKCGGIRSQWDKTPSKVSGREEEARCPFSSCNPCGESPTGEQ